MSHFEPQDVDFRPESTPTSSETLANGRLVMGPRNVVADYVEWLRDELERALAMDQNLPLARKVLNHTERAVPTAVYCALEDGSVIYVGIATDYERRVRQHRRRSPWVTKRTTFTLYRMLSSRREALGLEREMIEEIQPPFNIYLTDRDPRMGARS